MKKLLILSLLFIFSGSIFSQTLVDSYTAEGAKNYVKTLEIMEKLSKENGNDYFVQLRTGWIALIKGEYSKSSAYYQKAILLAPNAIEPRLGQIRALLALGQYKQVDVACKTVLKLDSKNYIARSTLAYSSYTAGNYKEAEKYYASVAADYPTDTEMLIGLGWSQLKQGNKDKARDTFTNVQKILPSDERISSGLYYANN